MRRRRDIAIGGTTGFLLAAWAVLFCEATLQGLGAWSVVVGYVVVLAGAYLVTRRVGVGELATRVSAYFTAAMTAVALYGCGQMLQLAEVLHRWVV